MYSLAYSNLIPCEVWDTSIINHLLEYGTEFYKYALSRCFNKNIRYLDVGEVIGEIQIFNNLFAAQYGINDILDSVFLGKISDIQIDLVDFVNSNCRTAILIAAGFTYGIIKNQNKLYFIDSHSKDDNGVQVDYGYGGVRIYNNGESLANYIISIHENKNTDYEFTYISITEINDTEEGSSKNFYYYIS